MELSLFQLSGTGSVRFVMFSPFEVEIWDSRIYLACERYLCLHAGRRGRTCNQEKYNFGIRWMCKEAHNWTVSRRKFLCFVEAVVTLKVCCKLETGKEWACFRTSLGQKRRYNNSPFTALFRLWFALTSCKNGKQETFKGKLFRLSTKQKTTVARGSQERKIGLYGPLLACPRSIRLISGNI